MRIEKELETCGDKIPYSNHKLYFITYKVADNQKGVTYSPFLNLSHLNNPDTVFVELGKLMDVDFLKENNIEFIFYHHKVIPIGLVDFIGTNNHGKALHVMVSNESDYVFANEWLKNIDKAISIKYRALEFTDQFSSNSIVKLIY